MLRFDEREVFDVCGGEGWVRERRMVGRANICTEYSEMTGRRLTAQGLLRGLVIRDGGYRGRQAGDYGGKRS
jgi:hypothetical protein